MRKVLITGVTGMDGSYLAKLLLEQGWEVWGGVRRSSGKNVQRLDYLGITKQVKFIPFEMLEYENLRAGIQEVQPDMVLHMAAQSFVGTSFAQPIYTADVTGMGTLRLLEAIKTVKPDCKFYFAGSSEQYGKVRETPQNELTPFYPRSPYAVAKTFGFEMTRNYRESYQLFASGGILFNHEGILRGLEFLPRKVTNTVARIYYGLEQELLVGNLNAQRDWGHSFDYCQAILKMMDHPFPDDFVIATNTLHTVRELIELAFKVVDIDIRWDGQGLYEVGRDRVTGKVLVRTAKEFYRPAEVDLLQGDYSKAERILGWRPTTSFEELVTLMVKHDLDLAMQERNGYLSAV